MARLTIGLLMIVSLTLFAGCKENVGTSEAISTAAPNVSDSNLSDRKNSPEMETQEGGADEVFEFPGTVVYVDLEGGFYGIAAEDGSQYDPINLPESFRKDGLEVTVTAKLREDMGGIHMYGSIIEVVDIVQRSTQASRSNDPRTVLAKTWQWESTVTPAEKITVPDPERYTFQLMADGKVKAKFDCNNGGGSYEISEGTLSFGPLISTRMACPEGSLDAAFMRDLQRVASFFMEDGALLLELPYDSGTMRFRATP